MKWSVIIMFLGIGMISNAQHVIKVKKSQTITGVFYHKSGDRTKDYLLFTDQGEVLILENTKKRSKKALKVLNACAAENACSSVKIKAYSFEKNVVNFAFENTTYVKDYSGSFEDNGNKILFKISETDQLMVVQEFERIE